MDNFPKKLNIGGVKYEIKIVDKVSDDNAIGEINFKNQTIRILKGVKPGIIEQILRRSQQKRRSRMAQQYYLWRKKIK